MKLTVKTLKGGKFTVEVEPSNTVAEAKGIIESAKSELPAAQMKLIHSGKVLKDDDTIESCNIKETDFLVVMITKAKKAPAPAPAAAAAPAPAAAAPAPAAAAPAPAAAPAAAESSSAPAPAPAAAAAAPTPAAAAAAPAPAAAAASEEEEFPAEMVGNLTAMGFPEAEVKACLRASGGNPDVAVEFLMNGIPPGVAEAAAARASGAAAAPAAGAGGSSSTSGGGGPLQALRNHPQFDALRRLVQSNPQTLQAVLTQIGQQDPQLLQEINENQAVFLEMMNEPIAEGGSAGGSGGAGASAGGAGAGAGAGAAGAGGMEAMLGGMSNPAQMAQMLQAMGPEERAQMAAMMGLTSEQLDATAQAIASMPPEQFQQYMQMAMAGGGGGMGGMMGGGGGGGGGGMAIQLTQEEMAAVDRLASMGFDRAEAAQAYLACDKNEELAANLLMDGGFGFADDGGAGGGGGAPPGGNGGGGDGDDMYD